MLSGDKVAINTLRGANYNDNPITSVQYVEKHTDRSNPKSEGFLYPAQVDYGTIRLTTTAAGGGEQTIDIPLNKEHVTEINNLLNSTHNKVDDELVKQAYDETYFDDVVNEKQNTKPSSTPATKKTDNKKTLTDEEIKAKYGIE